MLRGKTSSTRRRGVQTSQLGEQDKQQLSLPHHRQLSFDSIGSSGSLRSRGSSHLDREILTGCNSFEQLQTQEEESSSRQQKQQLKRQRSSTKKINKPKHQPKYGAKLFLPQSHLKLTITRVFHKWRLLIRNLLWQVPTSREIHNQQLTMISIAILLVVVCSMLRMTTTASSINEKLVQETAFSSPLLLSRTITSSGYTRIVSSNPTHIPPSYDIVFARSLSLLENNNSGGTTIGTSKTTTDTEKEIVTSRNSGSSSNSVRQEDYHVYIPQKMLDKDWDRRKYDFGGLNIYILEEDDVARPIFHDFASDITEFREYYTVDKEKSFPRDDDVDGYYAFDDDYVRGNYVNYSDPATKEEEDDDDENPHTCRRVSEHRLSFPNCNSVHEQALLDSNVKYLNHGAYRQAMVIDHTTEMENLEKIVVKELSYSNKFTYDMYEFVRMDAIVTERLTSKPIIADIYGFCGLSLLTEYFFHGDVERLVRKGNGYVTKKEGRRIREQSDPLIPENDGLITSLQRLEIATIMAESLTLLHGNPNGVIVHDDVQLSQFLLSQDMTTIKLNDFNRAEYMLWNDQKQEYCPYKNGKGGGDWRAPEEYVDDPLTEKIDAWSLCNNIHVLLTGLNPYFDETENVKVLLSKNKKHFIDERYKTRSKGEATMVDILERCYVKNPKKRISTFEIAKLLRQVLDEELKNEEQQEVESSV